MTRHVTFTCLQWQLATEPLRAVRIFPSFGDVTFDIGIFASGIPNDPKSNLLTILNTNLQMRY